MIKYTLDTSPKVSFMLMNSSGQGYYEAIAERKVCVEMKENCPTILAPTNGLLSFKRQLKTCAGGPYSLLFSWWILHGGL